MFHCTRTSLARHTSAGATIRTLPLAALVQAWPAYEAALKANNIRYEGYVYPKANHGFHNDTTPRYDEAAAKLAWQRTVDWFNKHLRS